MPSAEIVCVDQAVPGDFSHLPFAVQGGVELKSHRTPNPLFGQDFASLKGCIYHLAGPELKARQGMFIAWDLLSDRSRDASRVSFLEFRAEFIPAMHVLLESLMESSPARQLLFTSDWQFGPKQPYRASMLTLDEFWSRHNSCKLRLNGAYPIGDSGLSPRAPDS